MLVLPHTPPGLRTRDAAGSLPCACDAGAILVDPSTVAQRMGEIDAAAQSLDAQMQAKASAKTKADWGAWFARWHAYYLELNDGSASAWWQRFQSGTVDQVERYEDELRAWQVQFSKETGTAVSGPPLPKDERDTPGPLENVADSLTKLLLVAGGVYLVFKLV